MSNSWILHFTCISFSINISHTNAQFINCVMSWTWYRIANKIIFFWHSSVIPLTYVILWIPDPLFIKRAIRFYAALLNNNYSFKIHCRQLETRKYRTSDCLNKVHSNTDISIVNRKYNSANLHAYLITFVLPSYRSSGSCKYGVNHRV